MNRGPRGLLFGGLTGVVVLIVLARFGLLAMVSLYLFIYLVRGFPIDLDFSSWYVGASFFVLIVLFVIAVYGFRASLGGQPALGARLGAS